MLCLCCLASEDREDVRTILLALQTVICLSEKVDT